MKHKVLILILFVLSAAGLDATKDCPSPLNANLRDIGTSGFSWGLEGRGFFYHLDEGNYLFGGASLTLIYDGKAASGEMEMVFKAKPEVPCGDHGDISPLQVRRLNGEFHLSPRVSLRLGRQAIAAGFGMLLDDFFDGAVVRLGRSGRLRLGGGVIARSVARESLGCQKCHFYTFKSCWKDLWNQEWGDTGMAFLAWEFPLGRQRFEFMLIRGFSTDQRFRNTSAGLSGRMRLGPHWRLAAEAAAQYSDGGIFSLGFAAEVYRNWRLSGLGNLTLRFRTLAGPGELDGRMLPVFGNFYLGDRQHYSLRQGMILGAGLAWTPRFLRSGRFEVEYLVQVDGGPRSDELDLRLRVDLLPRGRLRWLAGYALWTAPQGDRSSQFQTQLRFVL